MQILRSHYTQYAHQVVYGAHSDIKCTRVSFCVLTFVKTYFISKQTNISCCSIFIFQQYIRWYISKDFAMLLYIYPPRMKKTDLVLVCLVTYFNQLGQARTGN